MITGKGTGAVELLQSLEAAETGASSHSVQCGFLAFGFDCKLGAQGKCERCKIDKPIEPWRIRRVFDACSEKQREYILTAPRCPEVLKQ